MGLDMYLSRNLDPNGNVLRIMPQDEFGSNGFAKLLKRATQSSESYLQPTINMTESIDKRLNKLSNTSLIYLS